MTNPPVVTTFGNPADPNATVANLGALVTILNTLVQSAIQGAYMPYVVGSTTPAVNDQDKVWARLDNSGRPIGMYFFYLGNWRRFYNADVGDVKFYSGDPTVDFDATGKGNVGGFQDGWQLCNGQNGAPDLSNLFIAGANMNSSGGGTQYNNGIWQTFVDGLTVKQKGGAANYTLQNSDLPSLRVQATGYDYNASNSNSTKRLFGGGHYDPNAPNQITLGVFGSNPTPQSGDPDPTVRPQTNVPVTPPYYALAILIFQGY